MDTQPLLAALDELTAVHEQAAARTEVLIAALTAADLASIRAASAAHLAVLRRLEQAETRRRLAVRGLTYTLLGGAAAAHGGPLPLTALLRHLPPEQAAPLAAARLTLLRSVLRLQVLQRRAAALAQSGQAVLQRTLRAALGPAAGGYDQAGAAALPAGALARRPGRWA